MASGLKITELTALTAANVASGDLYSLVDVSDTTMAASGTSKRVTALDVADASLRLGLNFTSGARPGSPARGRVIFETDTGHLLVYYGATTGWQRPWHLPWGVVARASRTTDQTTITSSVDITSLTVTFTAVTNRRYRITAKGEVVATAADGAYVLHLTDGSNNIQQRATDGCLTTSARTINLVHEETISSGSVTRKLRMSKAGGTGSLTFAAAAEQPGFIMVEDIGPLSSNWPAS